MVRLGLRALFQTVPEVEIVGEAATAAEAVRAAEAYRPDVVLLDIRLPDGDGASVCREIRSSRPDTQVIILTSYSDEDAVVASILAGAAGYLLKQTDPERLIDAVRIVVRGGSLLDPDVTRLVLERMRVQPTQPVDPLQSLSGSERNVLRLIAEGKTNRQIADTLSVSESTVKGHVSSVFQKLHLSRRAEAAAFIASHSR